jgi:hypothetical protein
MRSPGTAEPFAQHYSRVVSDALLDALRPGGPLRQLVEWRDGDLSVRDVQLRREPKGKRCWATLYLGLTSVLDIDELGGRFRLRAHATHRLLGHFDDSWNSWVELEALAARVPEVLAYLERVEGTVDGRWTSTEGRTHALVSNSPCTGIQVINREASVSFRDTATRTTMVGGWAGEIAKAVAGAGHQSRWWRLLSQKRMGTSPDFIAADAGGRLLVMEVKPASAAEGIVWGPAQVLVYAAMYAQWLHDRPEGVDSLREELAQRAALGLTAVAGSPVLAAAPVVVPVLVLGPGLTSPEVWGRLLMLQRALAAALPQLPALAPLEVWRLAGDGTPTVWHWADTDSAYPVPSPQDIGNSKFAERARAAAVAWKHGLGPEAQEDGPFRGLGPDADVYPFCLPTGHTELNLLTEAAGAVGFFSARGVEWHAAIAGGPSSHLVSSQVQCVNALFAMTDDPELVKRAFGDVLPIDTVLPVEDGKYLTFEYIGQKDHLGEVPGRHRRRGANCTSADAAIRYRTPGGDIEMALIEWKYTEQYVGSKLSADRADVRRARYITHWNDPDGPVRPEVIPYDDIFVEPFYQLVRQQMLAWLMEQDHEQDATRVRVVHVAPRANEEYYASLNRDSHRAAGGDVSKVWAKMLRRPDRFEAIDSAIFTDEARQLTSPAYRSRYGHG